MPDYPVLTPVLRDDIRYRLGDTLTLEPEDAAPLLRDGALADPEAADAPEGETDAAAKLPKRGKGTAKPAEKADEPPPGESA